MVAPGMTLISVNLVLSVEWPFHGVQCYSMSGGSSKTCLLQSNTNTELQPDRYLSPCL